MGTYVLLSVLILITCILLVLIVLVQNAKGGGLASNFSSSNQIMGVRKTTDFLEKTTWTLAIVLLILTLTTNFVIPRGEVARAPQESEVRDLIPATEAPPAQQLPTQEIPEEVEDIQDIPGMEDIED